MVIIQPTKKKKKSLNEMKTTTKKTPTNKKTKPNKTTLTKPLNNLKSLR